MRTILGIDEVGRGPWAGPLVVGAVILSADFPELENLTDSKKLTPKKRATLAPLILEHATTGLGWVSAAELDRHGLSASLKLATRRAVKQVLAQKNPFDEIIIDGTVNFLQNTPLADRVSLLKKADSLIPAVSAASIIAKVARDNYMIDLATKYPAYGFENHVGYGTAAHQTALRKHGICPEHRQSFRPIQKITLGVGSCSTVSRRTTPSGLERDDSLDGAHSTVRRKIVEQDAIAKGKLAETIVADYLQTQNHTIIAQNFKTKSYEIDLISAKNHKIYFTEVKYRHDPQHGSALTQITPEKQQQMRYAAEKFLSNASGQKLLATQEINPQNLQPLLAVAAVEGEPPTFKTWFPLEN